MNVYEFISKTKPNINLNLFLSLNQNKFNNLREINNIK